MRAALRTVVVVVVLVAGAAACGDDIGPSDEEAPAGFARYNVELASVIYPEDWDVIEPIDFRWAESTVEFGDPDDDVNQVAVFETSADQPLSVDDVAGHLAETARHAGAEANIELDRQDYDHPDTEQALLVRVDFPGQDMATGQVVRLRQVDLIAQVSDQEVLQVRLHGLAEAWDEQLQDELFAEVRLDP